MSRAMTPAEFNLTIEFIGKMCNPIGGDFGCRKIKYVYPSFDVRTGTYIAVVFKTFGVGEYHFTIVNEERENPDSLFDRVFMWLRKEIEVPLVKEIEEETN